MERKVKKKVKNKSRFNYIHEVKRSKKSKSIDLLKEPKTAMRLARTLASRAVGNAVHDSSMLLV